MKIQPKNCKITGILSVAAVLYFQTDFCLFNLTDFCSFNLIAWNHLQVQLYSADLVKAFLSATLPTAKKEKTVTMKNQLFKAFTVVTITCILTIPSTKNIDIVQAQNSSNQEINKERAIIEKELLNTTWTGTYKVYSDVHDTTLTIKNINSGYIGAEIIHKEISPGNQGFLRVKVAGDILTQYLIDLNKKGSFVWIDEDGITPEELAKASIKSKRQLIRLKRFRGLDYKNVSKLRGWNSNREYRLILQNNELRGSVGIPLERYGKSDVTRDDGTFVLQKK